MTTDNDFEWLDDDSYLDNENFDWLSDDYEIQTTRTLKTPIKHARKEAKRRFVSGLKKEALNTLIPELPPPDTDLWLVSNGSGAEIRHGVDPLKFDFGSFLPVIVEYLGNVNCKAYISTWTANRNHAKIIAIANQDETSFCCVMGSANLSAQPRVESYILSTAPDVYQFFKDEFFEVMLK